MFEEIVAALPQSLQKVESSSTFRNGCGNEKRARNVRCVVCYTAVNFRATCVATKLQDELQETLPSVTPPLLGTNKLYGREFTKANL